MNHLMKLAAIALLALTACGNDNTVVFYQVSDPQFGFYTSNADFAYETGTFTKAAQAINATSPDAVIYTGDIVHDHKDSLQWEEFLRIASTIDPKIKQLSLPGNHDVHGKAGRVDLTYWNRYIGADRFSERVGNVRLIGLDSNIYKYIEGSEADTEQKAWLESELAKGKKGEMTLVLAHHPFFLKSADEPEEYFNIKPDTRSYYRDLFRNAGVNAVICGHKHDNYVTADGDIPYITTSATGKPLGAAPSGVRAFVCEKGRLYHAYFTLDEIPGSRAELIDAVKNGSAAVPAPYGRFTDGEIGRINPEGWLREFLERQKSGLSGHPDAMSYPYNSCLWAGEISRNTGSYGRDWWRYEQTAYYTDGLLRLGYLLDDEELVKRGEEGVRYTLDNAAENGRLGNRKIKSMWPFCVFFRAMSAYYDIHGDAGLVDALHRHYLTFTGEDLGKWRNIVSIEGMLWTYSRTHDPRLLEMCEKAWNAGTFIDLTPETCAGDEKLFMHGVTCMEELKLPVLLYSYTGDRRYLDLALNAERRLERDDLLPDGVPASAEALVGSGNVINSHETCDITDWTWTLGYFLMATGDAKWADMIEKAVFNAGPGAITKDFKSLQYFSSVNQVIATGNSNHNDFFHGSTWMAYRPTHETECCAGNVHRIMPDYVSRMWMKGQKDTLVAALYGPSGYESVLSDGTSLRIRENTGYPFGDRIDFEFSLSRKARIPFTFRIPGWSAGTKVTLNGKEITPQTALAGSFCTIDRSFRDGDVLSVEFKAETRAVSFKDQGIYFERGPVLFSYPVPQDKVEDNAVYANMNGKVPEEEGFACWSITPAGDWNYAYAGAEGVIDDSLVTLAADGGYPFDIENAPVSITIPARHIEWSLKEGRYTPEMPAPGSVKVLDDKDLQIKLVPYGCTELRVSVFPVAE